MEGLGDWRPLQYFVSHRAWSCHACCRCCPRRTVVPRGVSKSRTSYAAGEIFFKFVSNSEITWLRWFWIQLQLQAHRVSILFSTTGKFFFKNLFLFTNVYYRLIYDAVAHCNGKLWAPWGMFFFYLFHLLTMSNIHLSIISSFTMPQHAVMEGSGLMTANCAQTTCVNDQVGFLKIYFFLLTYHLL